MFCQLSSVLGIDKVRIRLKVLQSCILLKLTLYLSNKFPELSKNVLRCHHNIWDRSNKSAFPVFLLSQSQSCPTFQMCCQTPRNWYYEDKRKMEMVILITACYQCVNCEVSCIFYKGQTTLAVPQEQILKLVALLMDLGAWWHPENYSSIIHQSWRVWRKNSNYFLFFTFYRWWFLISSSNKKCWHLPQGIWRPIINLLVFFFH